MTSPIRALIFDFDGLIIDTESPEFETWQEMFREFGAELKFEEWVACLGTSAAAFDAAAILHQRAGILTENAILWKEQKKRSTIKANQLQPLPGVVNLLNEAKSTGIGLAVASSSPRAWVQGHLERMGLTSYFRFILTKEDVRNVKPAPDLYLKAIQMLEVEPAEAVVLEDSPNGIKAARQAGLFCVAIPNPISRRLDLSEANLILDSLAQIDLSQLANLVARHNNGHSPLNVKV
ncbi:MAG: HAD family hydrolase [Chloroflexota bacterium]|nr:MAG: haloacid dehalogenase [Bellilinea sp.]